MVVNDDTFEQMLDMIEVNELIGYKTFKKNPHPYLGVLNTRVGKKEKFYDTQLFDYPGVVVFGLENAFVHGKFPIILNVFEGVKGIAIRIEDFGKGFDFKKTQKNYMEGEKYFNNHGCGFSFYNQKEHLVSFENEGTALNILHFFNQNDLKQKLAAENRIKG